MLSFSSHQEEKLEAVCFHLGQAIYICGLKEPT